MTVLRKLTRSQAIRRKETNEAAQLIARTYITKHSTHSEDCCLAEVSLQDKRRNHEKAVSKHVTRTCKFLSSESLEESHLYSPDCMYTLMKILGAYQQYAEIFNASSQKRSSGLAKPFLISEAQFYPLLFHHYEQIVIVEVGEKPIACCPVLPVKSIL